MVSIDFIQTRSVVNSNYRVNNSITTSSGIASEVFVKSESTYEFDRVATLQDMLDLPTTPSQNVGYYRDSSVLRDFKNVSSANVFSSHIKERLDLLVEEYETAINSFVGSESTIIKYP
jgi:hypothetical protein